MESKEMTLLEIKEDIGIITLNNPPGNALVRPSFIDLDELKRWIDQNQLKGILIQGSGKHFSQGADLNELTTLTKSTGALQEEIEKGKRLLQFLEFLPIPVVAAIKGTCFGGGLEIALSCHIRIASENALFAFPEVNHELMPGLGGANLSANLLGAAQSMHLVLGGDMINAAEAHKLGLVDHVVATPTTTDFAFSLLRKWTHDRSLDVITRVMRTLHNQKLLSKEEAMHEETRMFCELAVKKKVEDEENG